MIRLWNLFTREVEMELLVEVPPGWFVQGIENGYRLYKPGTSEEIFVSIKPK